MKGKMSFFQKREATCAWNVGAYGLAVFRLSYSSRIREKRRRTPKMKAASCSIDFASLGSSLRSSGIKSEPAM